MGGRPIRRGVAALAFAGLGAVASAQVASAAIAPVGQDSPALTIAIARGSSTAARGASGASVPVPKDLSSVGANPASDDVVPTFASDVTVAEAEQWMQLALSDRLSRLTTLDSQLNGSKSLAAADKASLSGLVSAAQSLCTQLQQQVTADSTLASLHEAASEMIASLHVYAILSPQVELTVNAETLAGAAAKLQALEPGLNTAIAAAHATKRNLARLHVLESELATQAAAAAGAVAPLPGQLVLLSGSDLTAALSVITPATTAVQSARADVAAAGSALRRLLSLLAKAGLTSKVRLKVHRLGASVSAVRLVALIS